MRPQVTTRKPAPTRRHVLSAALGFASVALLAPSAPVMAQGATEKGYEIMDAQTAFDNAANGEIVLVDIRTPQEWQQTGIGEGAVALDMRDADFVKSLVDLRQAYPEKPIALICRTGNRSGYVVSTLAEQGFPGLVDVSEGMEGGPNGVGWVNRGLPTYAGTEAEIAGRLQAALNP